MLTICYSPKGGQGCTTVAVALALACARSDVLVIDTAGDVSAVAGLPAPAGPGICDLAASDHPLTSEALARVALHVPALSMIPAGTTPAYEITEARWRHLPGAVPPEQAAIVDAATNAEVAAIAADRRIMVIRACYLALRRAAAMAVRPDEIVLVADHYRAITERDIEATLAAPVTATVPVTPLVARTIDAGLLTTHLPSVLTRSLRPLTAPPTEGTQR